VLLGRLGASVSGAEGAAGVSLPGTTWRLEAFGPVAAPAPVSAGTPATLSFGADGRLSGNSGCNGFGGSYSVAGDQVTFGALTGTLRACDEVTNQQERAVYAALSGTVRYTVEGERLRIFAPGGADVLVFGSQAGEAEVTGSVTYRDRMALPAGALVTVRLVDVSRQDVAATIIAEQVITTTGQQVPIAFALRYDPAQIQERNTYAVQARIEVDGQLRYTSTEAYLVLTQGRPTNVEVVVERA
jgi:putative lipoprotein